MLQCPELGSVCQPVIHSNHADLVTTQRDGKFIYYQINRKLFGRKTVTSALDLGCCRIEMQA